jgi:hypothetical protein
MIYYYVLQHRDGDNHRHANDDYHPLYMHRNAGGQILGSVPLAKLEDGCYRSLRPNHFAGSNTDREAGSVESISLAGVTAAAPISKTPHSPVYTALFFKP